MFCTRIAWVCLVCLQLCQEECSSPVSLQLLRGGALVYVSVGFWDGDCVSQLPYLCIMFVLRAVFHMLVMNASPRMPMYFRCLMFVRIL